MQLPLIIISTDDSMRQDKIDQILSEMSLSENSPLILRMEDKLGIESIKQIKYHLLLRSGEGESKVIIINPADGLTLDAQNALLKLLEEPQGDVVFILGVVKEESLLNTVRSRCQSVNLEIKPSELAADDQKFIEDLLAQEPETRLEMVEKIENKKDWLEKLVFYYHQKLKNEAQLLNDVKKVLTAQKWIKQNVMPKAVIDYLMLALEKH